MKKVFVLFASAALFVACGSSSNKPADANAETPVIETVETTTVSIEGDSTATEVQADSTACTDCKGDCEKCPKTGEACKCKAEEAK